MNACESGCQCGGCDWAEAPHIVIPADTPVEVREQISGLLRSVQDLQATVKLGDEAVAALHVALQDAEAEARYWVEQLGFSRAANALLQQRNDRQARTLRWLTQNGTDIIEAAYASAREG